MPITLRRGKDVRRQPERRADAHTFVAAAGAGSDLDRAGRHSEAVGQEADQVRIGGAVDGRSGDTDLEAVAVRPDDGVVSGARLHMHGKP